MIPKDGHTNQLDMSNSRPMFGVVPKTAFTACLDMYLRSCPARKRQMHLCVSIQ